MAGTALADLTTAIAAAVGADQTLGLATGIDITAQLNAIKGHVRDAALINADLAALAGLSGGLAAALAVVATDFT
jgi:hypothetical protein